MKILVTGATGYIGTAVVDAMVKAGHEVTGLVRTREKAAAVRARGATPLQGSLAEPATYVDAAAAHDACIHLGFDTGRDAVATDRTAIEALLDATSHQGDDPAVLVYTSGVLVLGETGDTPADESASTADAVPLVAWRPAHEQLVLVADRANRVASVVRPGFVYAGTQGVIAGYFESAVREGAAVYVGHGANRMALVQPRRSRRPLSPHRRSPGPWNLSWRRRGLPAHSGTGHRRQRSGRASWRHAASGPRAGANHDGAVCRCALRRSGRRHPPFGRHRVDAAPSAVRAIGSPGVR